jgi:hypothetical protein
MVRWGENNVQMKGIPTLKHKAVQRGWMTQEDKTSDISVASWRSENGRIK